MRVRVLREYPTDLHGFSGEGNHASPVKSPLVMLSISYIHEIWK
jgi:hypothetical protein